MRARFLTIIGLILLLSSCVDEIFVEDRGDIDRIIMAISDFEAEDGIHTRSAYDMSDLTYITSQWSLGDTVGIFPSKGDQVSFPMTKGAGENSATFDGGGWALKNSSAYYAYYPFSRKYFDSPNRIKNIPYTFDGQKVAFEDENGVVQVGDYDYMYASAGTPESGSVNFHFRHLGSLARFEVIFPATATFTTLRITASEAVFPIEGTYDLTAETVAFEPKRYSYTLDVNLENLSASEGEKKFLYFMIPPVDYSTLSLFDATLITDSSDEYTVAIEKKNVLAGKAYGWSLSNVSVSSSKKLYLDGTANSYIVSSADTYSFPTVKGNSNESVGTVATAEVLWETFGTDVTISAGDLITSVSYADNMITFSTASEFKEGNAVIAAKDAGGNILWSWHIWLTDKPEDQVYCNDAGIMMDRNLGATSATPGDVGALGLLYQWGRKDPFLGSSSISSSIMAESTLSSWPTESSTESTGTIAYAIAHPTTKISKNSNNQDWWYSGNQTTDDVRWTSTKTLYDPCPVGYRVPDGGSTGIWATAFGTSDIIQTNAELYYDNGFNLGKNDVYKYLTEESTCWYPAACDPGVNGSYWSCSTNGKEAYYMTLNYLGAIFPSYSDERSRSQSVRCQKDGTSELIVENTKNLSKEGTANSYIVSESGSYKFSTVKGNSNESVGEAASAEVLWETFGTDVTPNVGSLVYDVKYSNNAVSFKATDRKGNAVIAAKDAEGNILWSWHIWLTDKPEDQVYCNDAGIMMDRNLGATSATPGEVGALGLMYQWGRKDPFLGSSDISLATKAMATLSSWPTESSTESRGNMEYAISHPTTYITYNGSNSDWLYGAADNTLWASTKTIYDPCPIGYRVPDGGGSGVWVTAFGTSTISTSSISFHASKRGYDFVKSGTDKYLTNETTCWYPAVGYVYNYDGKLDSLGSYGTYWSCTTTGSSVYTLDFSMSNIVNPKDTAGRGHGYAVRCLKE